MRDSRRFIPSLERAALEDRALLSTGFAQTFQLNLPGATAFLTEPIRHHGGGPLRMQIADRYAQLFQQEFTNFANLYASDVNNTLLAEDGSAAGISANRTAFDALVSNQVGSLSADVANLLSVSPRAAFSLTPAAQGLLSGTLLSQLNALPTTPTDTSGSTSATLGTQSSAIISSAFGQLTSMLDLFAVNPSFDFTTLGLSGAGGQTGTSGGSTVSGLNVSDTSAGGQTQSTTTGATQGAGAGSSGTVSGGTASSVSTTPGGFNTTFGPNFANNFGLAFNSTAGASPSGLGFDFSRAIGGAVGEGVGNGLGGNFGQFGNGAQILPGHNFVTFGNGLNSNFAGNFGPHFNNVFGTNLGGNQLASLTNANENLGFSGLPAGTFVPVVSNTLGANNNFGVGTTPNVNGLNLVQPTLGPNLTNLFGPGAFPVA